MGTGLPPHRPGPEPEQRRHQAGHLQLPQELWRWHVAPDPLPCDMVSHLDSLVDWVGQRLFCCLMRTSLGVLAASHMRFDHCLTLFCTYSSSLFPLISVLCGQGLFGERH